jgi:hypothetical protein
MSTARSTVMEILAALFTLPMKRMPAKETGRGGGADCSQGHVEVREWAVEHGARDLLSCKRRLARARAFPGSGAVGRRWRPEAPGLMVDELCDNPLANKDSWFMAILTPPWTSIDAAHDLACCSAPQRSGKARPITADRTSAKGVGSHRSESSLAAARRFEATTFAFALERRCCCLR